ncbi:CoA transferase [Aeromicrobium sp. YIM 150415]|uniref:CaiB/BaiF CoA transferase family protein n=1 Tax=Aeromicrobium sp. YIM 150415 TaxID=2803912 RepID=UPI00196607F0|nr:CoA transferase [Aeromicrobium sp. YIM 150415]MBM9464100.1 CoA transferase [Aeromicrobium sp. YIM 150415]
MNGAATRSGSANAPLAGVRILDLCRVVSGPFGSLLLADLGAEVIRIESVPTGDPAAIDPSRLSEDEAFNWGLSRNKHSVSINLKSERGRELFYGLVAQADVVLDNFRPGVTTRLGIDRATLAEHNPSIVTCSLTGFGGDGPWSTMPAYDPIVQAMCGTMNYTRLAPDQPPVRWGIPIGDLYAGIFSAMGTVGAIIERDRTGVGQHIDVSMLDVMLALNTYRVPQALTFGEEPLPAPFEGGQGTVPFGNFECADGWVAICISQRMWPAAAEVMGRPDFLADERFSTGPARHAHRDALVAELQKVFKARSADWWQEHLMAAGVVCGKVTSVADVFVHPQVRDRGMSVDITDEFGRTATVAGDALRFSDPATWRAPRQVGADTALVLQSLLGLEPSQLEQLGSDGIVHAGDPNGGIPLCDRSAPSASGREVKSSGGPLRGVTVLEMNGDEPSKAFAAQLLADFGADVIRVERPYGQVVEPYPDESREASFRAGLNRGKRSVIADLKTQEGRDFLLGLASHADVVLDNYRPGVLGRLGLDYDSLREVNEQLISTSITGFGHSGPWSSYPAFDNAIQALGGGMSVSVDHTRPDVPIRWGNPIGGLTGAMFAALGTLAALRLRDLNGHGQKLDISLLDSQVALLSYRAPQAVTVGKEFLPEPRRGGTGSLPFGVFRTADDRWFTICITPQFWAPFCRAAGHPEWIDDPRFATEPLRRANDEALYELVEPSFLVRTAQEWEELYYSLKLPGAIVLNIEEAFSHPQAVARRMRLQLKDPDISREIEVAGVVLKLSDAASTDNISIPGVDTVQVAAEFGLPAPDVEIRRPSERWRGTEPSAAEAAI